MTPEQRKQLIQACEDDDDVRIVTIALQVAASAARAGRSGDALAIRKGVDAQKRREHLEQEYRRLRLEVAVGLARLTDSAEAALSLAEAMIEINAEMPVKMEI